MAWYAGLMTGNQFRRALADLGLTQEAAAELLGLGERTVTGYAGGRPIPVPVAILINLMVGGVVTPDEVDAVR
jgi:transcriptional regulator with XRE-family HTH domain